MDNHVTGEADWLDRLLLAENETRISDYSDYIACSKETREGVGSMAMLISCDCKLFDLNIHFCIERHLLSLSLLMKIQGVAEETYVFEITTVDFKDQQNLIT
jgi:hypothetical protein